LQKFLYMIAYFRLIRPVNLLIMALTQYLVKYCIIGPFMSVAGVDIQMSHVDFALFVFSNLLLAAAGYAINDYFDVDVDSVNKPDKNMLLEKIPRKHAVTFNIILNVIACIIGFYCAIKVGSFKLGFISVVISLVLYYYSLKYKRQFVTGNIVLALVAAYCVLSVWLFEFFAIKSDPDAFIGMMRTFRIITVFAGGFAVFAFLTTFIREIIKDMEDIEGDNACGCHTIPIQKGMGFTKKMVAGLNGLTMLLLAAAQLLLYEHYPMLTWYLCVLQILFINLIIKILRSKSKSDYHFSSVYIKIIMVAGILSTQLLYIYF